MKRMFSRLVVTFIALAGVVACRGAPEPERPAPRVISVATLSPELSTEFQVQRRVVGRVEAAQRVDIGFEQGGKIDSILVDQGQAVIAGQKLAALDKRLLEVAGKELEAQLRETRARLELVLSSLKRQQSLKKQGFSAEQQLDELAAEKQALMAGIERLGAGLDANRLRLEKAALLAPYDGVISRRFEDEGAVVGAGSPVLQLLESGQLEVVFGVPVDMAGGIEQGAAYPVTVGNDTFQATLIAVGSDLNAITRTVKLRFALPDDVSLRDGELALLMVSRDVRERGYWLPVSALADGVRGLWNSYVLEPLDNNQYRVQAVNVGVLHVEADRVYVSADFGSKQVIATGLHRVVPGQIVNSAPSEES
jgi:RND family efflux transporter MFP subunit